MRNLIPVLFLALMAMACGRHAVHGNKSGEDSLLLAAYRLRYTNADSTETLARQVLRQSGGDAETAARAYNTLAFGRYHAMDYDKALLLCDSACALSRNQIVLLCSDVMRMKVCQRIGDGRRFYESRSSASKRLKRIQEEADQLSSIDLHDYNYARSEYHIISSTYYYYQDQDSLSKAEMAYLKPLDEERADTLQWLNYMYMMGSGGLVDGTYEEVAYQEFDFLINCYVNAMKANVTYFEGNALQALSTRLKTEYDRQIIREHFVDAYGLLFAQHIMWMPTDSVFSDKNFPLALARHALDDFMDYKDLFQTACVQRTIGELSFENGRYDEALVAYEQALECVNLHHEKYYPNVKGRLRVYDPQDTSFVSIERKWIDDETTYTVPEWMAGIRQQISMTFSALGMKKASDYNRNIYLDILESTTQNKEMESRMRELQDESDTQHHLLWAAASVLLLLVVLFVVMIVRLKPHVLSKGDEDDAVAKKNKNARILRGDKRKVEDLNEQLEEMHEAYEVSRMRIRQNKVRNMEKRAKVSLVQTVTPFLDRIINEVARMKRRQQVNADQLAYITELSDQIVDYNDILTEWIQMERGQLALQISTIDLNEIFAILERGHYAFDQQGVTLKVVPTDYQVKADKALTLFMLNTLADNARKFTPSGGSVTVSAAEGEGYVELSVTDTGCGLKPEDIDTIVNSKVYDAGQIGSEQTQGKKGFGFGLINCKGIIEKYKKASRQFSVCSFGIESQLGVGSRFYFRLPRVLMLAFAFLGIFSVKAMAERQIALNAQEAEYYYQMSYDSNLNGFYEDAVAYGDSALMAYSSEILLYQSDLADDGSVPAEIEAFNKGEKWDYQLIMNIRNEIAVAALALNDWDLYRYNNRICINLHKLYNQDESLPTYCEQLQKTKSKSQQITVLLVLLCLFGVVVIFLLFRGRRKMAESITNSLQQRIDQQQDLLSHSRYEESRLHVQNQILDNCLSTIKHESMYYPSRIRQLVSSPGVDLQQLDELTSYYKQMYTLLSGQAERQTANSGQRREVIDVSKLLHDLPADFNKLARKASSARLTTSPSSTDVSNDSDNAIERLFVRADATLLAELFRQLFTYVISTYPQASEFHLKAESDGKFVRFTLSGDAILLTDQEAHNLFYPDAKRIPLLLVKQIVRDTDALNNNPGLRLIAETNSIWFTLPRSEA